MIGKTFFTADQMFGSEATADWRDFEDPDAMDMALREAWNDTVGPDDVVWVLGSFSQGLPHPELVPSLHGRKYLVASPLDVAHQQAVLGEKSRARVVAQYRTAGFTAVVTGTGIARKFGRPIVAPLRGFPDGGSRPVVLSSLPFAVTEKPDRFAAWRPKHTVETITQPIGDALKRAVWGLHGRLVDGAVGPDQINVGADAWGWAPVPASAVVDQIVYTERLL